MLTDAPPAIEISIPVKSPTQTVEAEYAPICIGRAVNHGRLNVEPMRIEIPELRFAGEIGGGFGLCVWGPVGAFEASLAIVGTKPDDTRRFRITFVARQVTRYNVCVEESGGLYKWALIPDELPCSIGPT